MSAGDPVCWDLSACGHHTGFISRGNLPPWGASRERPECDIKLSIGATFFIFPRGYLLRSFPHGDSSARQLEFEFRVFPLLGELPNSIEFHLPVCQLYPWQLGPNMWYSPTTNSMDPIINTNLQLGFQG